MRTTSAPSSEKSVDAREANCGTTAAEARALGCSYEPMQRSWIPADCYFPEPSDEYHPFDDREWYSDEERTQLVNSHQMNMLRNGDDFVAYTRYFHHEHCLYAWRKMAIAVEYQRPMIDTKSADLHHTTHCAKIIAKMIVEAETHTFNNSASFTYSPLMFQTCVPLNWKQ
ncbi:hypothetical protein DL98DRAFT_427007 [Cadophora sp. DSE1049]|nr:hypothetical protein DL98DRAFT_427007 [Cadophora sp. DSE1049]